MPYPFIILSTQRSGSTALMRSLDTHPEIFCAGEMFNGAKGMHHKEWHFGTWGISQKIFSFLDLSNIILTPSLEKVGTKYRRDNVKKFIEIEKAIPEKYAAFMV